MLFKDGVLGPGGTGRHVARLQPHIGRRLRAGFDDTKSTVGILDGVVHVEQGTHDADHLHRKRRLRHASLHATPQGAQHRREPICQGKINDRRMKMLRCSIGEVVSLRNDVRNI